MMRIERDMQAAEEKGAHPGCYILRACLGVF